MQVLTSLLFIGSTEIIFILLIVVMVFGADKLPEIARGLGKGMRQIKDASTDIKQEIVNSAKETNLNESEIAKDIESEITRVKDEIEDVSGSIKREN